MQGLIIARNYFDGDGPEAELRARINELWHDVDWAWFTRGPSGSENDGLYWHWSPEYGFAMNMKVTGFNEGMVAYVLALASPTHPIPSEAYAAWSSTDEYRPTGGNGYTLEAGIPYGAPCSSPIIPTSGSIRVAWPTTRCRTATGCATSRKPL